MKNNLFAILTGIIWSISFVAAKFAVDEVEPFTLTLIRYGGAFLLLSIYLLKFDLQSFRIKKKDLIWFLLLGLSGITFYHYLFFTSLDYTLVTNTAIIQSFGPVLTVIGAALLLKEKLTKLNYAGVVLSLIGVITLITKGSLQILRGFAFNFGDILMVGAMLLWVVYTLIVKKLGNQYKSSAITLYAFLAGSISLLFLVPSETIEISAISASAWTAILYMTIVASFIGFLLFNKSVETLGPSKTATVVQGMLPVGVAFVSFILLGESITFPMILSMILVIFGLYLVLMKR